MKLIGTYGSPYTRRVAITLKLYGIEFELDRASPFGADKARLRRINPIARIPVLQLPDGEYISESSLIIDHLDSLVDETQRLTPANGRSRRDVLAYASMASAATDKLVASLYEFHFRPPDKVYKPWIRMCDEQVADSFRWLDAAYKGPYMLGNRLTQADISIAVFWLFGKDKRARFFDRMNCAKLDGLSDRLAETEAFRTTPSDGPLPEGISLGARDDADS